MGETHERKRVKYQFVDGEVSTAIMKDMEPSCCGLQLGLCGTVSLAGAQHTWHHRVDQEEGDRRHLQTKGVTLVMAEEREAEGSSSSTWSA